MENFTVTIQRPKESLKVEVKAKTNLEALAKVIIKIQKTDDID